MYSMSNEAVRPGDLELGAAFKAAKGFKPEQTLTRCGLGWFAEYVREIEGLEDDKARAMAQRIYFHENPHEAAVFNRLAAGTASIKDTVAYVSDKCGIPEKAARDAVRNAFGGAHAFATLDKDFNLRLLNKGEPVGYWP